MKIDIPVNIGDTIYVVPSHVNYEFNKMHHHEENNRVYAQVVDHIRIYPSGYYLSTCDGLQGQVEQLYGETWFLSGEEALHRLAELEIMSRAKGAMV